MKLSIASTAARSRVKILPSLVLFAALSPAATYGPPLIPRAVPDNTVGAAILYQQVIPQGESVVSFSFFNNLSANRNWITPLVLQSTGGNSYKLIGIGESRQNTGAGIQKHPFNVKYGSALAAGANYVFGWWSGRIEQSSQGAAIITTGTPNASIVPLDTAASTPGFRESCPAPNIGPCAIALNPFTLPTYTFANIYAGASTGSLAAPFGRLYSIQFETVEVPIPVVTSVLSLTGFGGAPRIAPGGWIEIFGTRFAAASKQWAATDFSSDFGPTLLDGVRVTIAGKPAFISFVSPTQINCVVPDGIGTGSVNVLVTNAVGSSVAFAVTAAPRVVSLLAPAEFKSGGKQYIVAQHPDQVFAGPENLIPGAAFRLPAPGDKLTVYGVSLGEPIPAIPAGKIATVSARFPNVQVRFADVPALVEYAGPVSGLVGLSQLNIVVPNGAPAGDVPITFSVDGVASTQELWIAIK